jgi:hypothetical protein
LAEEALSGCNPQSVVNLPATSIVESGDWLRAKTGGPKKKQYRADMQILVGDDPVVGFSQTHSQLSFWFWLSP